MHDSTRSLTALRRQMQAATQVALTVICMVVAANLQYGWQLFVLPLDARFQWGRAEIQYVFTILVLSAAWLMPFAGYAADRFGTRVTVVCGGVFAALSWIANAYADALSALYMAALAGGAGLACVYGGCIGHTLKWCKRHRGLAVGFTAAGFGTMSAATVLPLHYVIADVGYERAFLYVGAVQGIAIVATACFLRPAPEIDAPRGAPLSALATPAFWIMYALFFIAVLAGVMAIAQLGAIAKEFGIANSPVTIVQLTLPALAFALTMDRICSGFAKPLFGWAGDRFGAESALGIGLAGEALAIFALPEMAHDPLGFVVITGAIFFGWGQIYAVFPALCAEVFGTSYCATQTGMLFTAKGAVTLVMVLFGAVLVPTLEWRAAFYSAAALNALAAVIAGAALRPVILRMRAQAHRSN